MLFVWQLIKIFSHYLVCKTIYNIQGGKSGSRWIRFPLITSLYYFVFLFFSDSRTQIVTLYDKISQKEIGVYSAEYLPTGENKLWRVEIFPDNSLLLRFDDDERTGDRSQVIHHIVVHVKKNEINGKYEAISQIQATNVYGFAIGSDSEVIVGLRKSNCFEGLISCYV